MSFSYLVWKCQTMNTQKICTQSTNRVCIKMNLQRKQQQQQKWKTKRKERKGKGIKACVLFNFFFFLGIFAIGMWAGHTSTGHTLTPGDRLKWNEQKKLIFARYLERQDVHRHHGNMYTQVNAFWYRLRLFPSVFNLPWLAVEKDEAHTRGENFSLESGHENWYLLGK